jgi:hypothetical protein
VNRTLTRNPGTFVVVGAGCTALVYGLMQLVLSVPPAQAQVPDSGAQRNAMITELQRANEQLAQIVVLLKEQRETPRAAQPKVAEKSRKP